MATDSDDLEWEDSDWEMDERLKPRPTVNLLQELVQRDLDTFRRFRVNEREVRYFLRTLEVGLRTQHGLKRPDQQDEATTD